MNQERRWFLLENGHVSGPFSKEEIEAKSPSATSLIWGRGQSEWFPHEKWLKFVSEFFDSDGKTVHQHIERSWKIQVDGQELNRTFNHEEMVDFLKTKADLSRIRIWTEGYTEWKEIFQIHKIMDELGVSRRAHPRVPIMGLLTCEGPHGTFSLKALSISEGGLGVTDASHVKIGEKYKTTLKSPNLYAPIHATAEVVYVGQEGYAGLKFNGLHSESKSAIIEYVKKFSDIKK